MMQKSGDRRLTNRHFLRRQYGLELSQRDIRLLCHQLPDQVLVRRQSIPLVSAEFGRNDTARFAVEPTKADHRADTHTEALRNFRYRGALLLRPHHARTQILRIRLPHPILASFPARILNPIRVRMGIPPDSVFSGNALTSDSELDCPVEATKRAASAALRRAAEAAGDVKRVPICGVTAAADLARTLMGSLRSPRLGPNAIHAVERHRKQV